MSLKTKKNFKFFVKLSIAFTIMFVIQNYHVLNKHENIMAYDVIDLCLCGCFLFHWVVDLILSKNK